MGGAGGLNQFGHFRRFEIDGRANLFGKYSMTWKEIIHRDFPLSCDITCPVMGSSFKTASNRTVSHRTDVSE